ncbi:hypothetical protein AAFL31_15225 [Klebsiella huaxiensis]|uniref:hypothetical protein n=1 Tax=Klebsiella huaxiensis TaxID=2153354 RepID=UPI0031601A50
MARKEVACLWLSIMVFLISCAVFTWHYFYQQDYTFHCSGNLSLFHDNTSHSFLQGKFHLALESDGTGYIRLDGESLTGGEQKALHRLIFFNYHPQPIAAGKDFILDEYRIVRAPADVSDDKEFLMLVNTISQGSQKLRIRLREINPRTSLINSINSPLLVCTSQQVL